MNISVNRMNPEVKAKWLTALRSGEYNQTIGALKDDKGFCCLGILCDLHSKENNLKWSANPAWAAPGGRCYPYLGSLYSLPETVWRWASLTSHNPIVSSPWPDWVPESARGSKTTTLAYLNDELRFTFNQIADVIEKEF